MALAMRVLAKLGVPGEDRDRHPQREAKGSGPGCDRGEVGQAEQPEAGAQESMLDDKKSSGANN